MPQNDLVTEIEEALNLIQDNTYHNGDEVRTYELDSEKRQSLVQALQRAREALRWIPVSEQLPKEYADYEVTRYHKHVSDSLKGELTYYVDWSGYHPGEKKFGKPYVVAWRERSDAYRPNTPPKEAAKDE